MRGFNLQGLLRHGFQHRTGSFPNRRPNQSRNINPPPRYKLAGQTKQLRPIRPLQLAESHYKLLVTKLILWRWLELIRMNRMLPDDNSCASLIGDIQQPIFQAVGIG